MGTDLKTAFLLTAGIGSRLAPHTDHKPKPSLPFLGLPLMDYGFYLTQKSNFKNYLFNLHHLPEKLLVDVNKLKPLMNECHLLDEKKELLGSGGAIWNARDILKDKECFLIANGDEILIPQNIDIFDKLIEHFKRNQSLCTLLTCDHPELLKSLKPVWTDEASNLLGFGSEPINKDSLPEHYTGYKVFSSRIFDFLPEGNSHIFYDVLVKAIKNGEKVNTFKIDHCHWYETGNFKSFVLASRECLLHHLSYINEVHHFYGNTMELIKKDDDLLYKPSSLKLPHSFSWSGTVALGPNSIVEDNVHLNNTFLESNAHIKANSSLKNQFVLAN
jgi:NDP-sugar pyrophosphorylase family protein